jgi:hypothetical protein
MSRQPGQAHRLRFGGGQPLLPRRWLGKDLAPSHVMLDIAQDPFMATGYLTALIVVLKSFLAAFRFSATS